MREENLYASSGPVSSMPGSGHPFPEGTKCDQHEDRLAVRRIQGETDSFGCEYVMMCQECVDAYHAHMEQERNTPKYCQWCRQDKIGVRQHRDLDEGMAGPLYDVCGDCIRDENDAAALELQESGAYDNDFHDPD